MKPKTKVILLLGTTTGLFICFLGLGIYMNGKQANVNDNKSTKRYSTGFFKELLERPINAFTPKVALSQLAVSSRQQNSITFMIEKEDSSFRLLKLKIEKEPGYSADAKADYIYSGESPITDLKKQTDALNDKQMADSQTSLIIFKDGGQLKLTPQAGARIMGFFDNRWITLCRKTTSRRLELGNNFD